MSQKNLDLYKCNIRKLKYFGLLVDCKRRGKRNLNEAFRAYSIVCQYTFV